MRLAFPAMRRSQCDYKIFNQSKSGKSKRTALILLRYFSGKDKTAPSICFFSQSADASEGHLQRRDLLSGKGPVVVSPRAAGV
jgi:hypothetical protein